MGDRLWIVKALPDSGRDRILRATGLDEGALLGAGGEARVYALDEHRILRVPHDGQDLGAVRTRQHLVDELGSQGAPFFLPELLFEGEIEGRPYAIERRLPGQPVSDALHQVEGRARSRLIEAYLEASTALGSLHLAERGWFGELLGDQPVRASTWRAYLRDRAAWSLSRSTPELQQIDPDALAADLPGIDQPTFVHLDAYAANMLTDHETITAVLDVGVTSLSGDRRFDPIASAVYLSTPLITPASRPIDERVANAWLSAAGLVDLVEPVQRWLAAFWAFAVDDPRLYAWCQSVLLSDS